MENIFFVSVSAYSLKDFSFPFNTVALHPNSAVSRQ